MLVVGFPAGPFETNCYVVAPARGEQCVVIDPGVNAEGQLEEAERLADRISILHGGRILVEGTLAELKALLPPAEVTYVERQPSLEDVFLALVGGTPAPTTDQEVR